MLGWKRNQRAVLVAVLPPLANLGFGALILGQTFSQRPFSWLMFAIGLMQWVALVLIAVLIAGIDE
jgi:hypothetical protein